MPGLTLLPVKEGVCQECGTDHRAESPHNQQSLYWQCAFYGQHGRWPTWADAMAHCDDQTKQLWTQELAKLGVIVPSLADNRNN